MSDAALQVLWIEEGPQGLLSPADLLADDAWGRYAVQRSAGLLSLASGRVADGTDAVVLAVAAPSVDALLAWPPLSVMAGDVAVIVLVPEMAMSHAHYLFEGGVQDVVLHADAASLAQRLRLAVARKRIAGDALKAFASDLSTGLPNRFQLVEHMSHLLALRRREPKPVSLLVFHMDGLAPVEVGLGHESANVVRRKVAVRLRAGVRASDVVASLGINVFAVLLSSTESPEDASHVVQKLVRSLRDPFNVAGTAVSLSSHVGVAQFPANGRQPEELLRYASSEALLGASSAGQDAAND